jgi:hypothetical protein
MATAGRATRINLKLRELAQLFNSMDPSPFIERDLDNDAEEFIVSGAQELPRSHGFELAIHLANPPEPEKAAEVQDAVQHYFTSRAEIKRRELRLLLRRGHVSLSIGLLFLAVCLLLSGLVTGLGYEPVTGIIREGLIIAGWVAMWRPLQIYLYDWWPMREEWKDFQQLARMRVKLVLPHAVDPGPTPPKGPVV